LSEPANLENWFSVIKSILLAIELINIICWVVELIFGRSLISLNSVEQKMEPEHDDNEKRDQDYKPHGIPSRQAIKPPHEKYSRRSKRYGPGDASDSDNPVILYKFFCYIGYMCNIRVDFQLNKAQNGSGQAD
jgi:hypothetical protein